MDDLKSKISNLKIKIEEAGLLKEMLHKKHSERKDESLCFESMSELSSKNFFPFELMNSHEFKLMILDNEFGLDSTSNRSFSEQTYDKTVHMNQRLKSEFVQNLKQMVSYKGCKRCKKDYLPIQNNNNSCKHHPGNKKYFSCKNCGKDVYYTCCNWCEDCIEGCMLTYHV